MPLKSAKSTGKGLFAVEDQKVKGLKFETLVVDCKVPAAVVPVVPPFPSLTHSAPSQRATLKSVKLSTSPLFASNDKITSAEAVVASRSKIQNSLELTWSRFASLKFISKELLGLAIKY